MITIQSGKLIIPEEDRFVGFAGDNLGTTKRFVFPDRGSDSGSYTLCLRFDDDSVRVIPLTKSLSDGDLVLTWNIQKSHLLKAGIVMAQLKSVDSDDVIMHTSCDYFIISTGAELNDDGITEYVDREELEERMTAFLEKITNCVPYIGEDNYWYEYDAASDSYVRSVYAVGNITVDSAVTDGGKNPVEGGSIKRYVDSALDDKADKNTYIAGLPLSGNISRADLAMNLSGNINPPLVTPDSTVGYGGQYGKTADGKPVMCLLANSWIRLATENDLSEKMALAPTRNNAQIDDLPVGQLFLSQGGVCVKISSGYIELARVSNVYSKSEIDRMIGALEAQLSEI